MKTATEKMYSAITKAETTANYGKMFREYHLAAIYAGSSVDLLNKEEVITELTEKRDNAYRHWLAE